jgi:hypothetical protein
MAVDSSCSKCEKPLDTDGFPHWCKSCRARYKREYEALRKDMAETRGYAAGVSAMREFVASNFAAYALPRMFSGAEIAHIVRTCSEPVAP